MLTDPSGNTIVRGLMTSIGSGEGGTPFRRIARIDRMPILLLTALGLFGCGDGGGARDGGVEAGADAAHTGGRSGSGGARVDGGAGHGAGGGGGSSLGAGGKGGAAGAGGVGGFAGGEGGAISTGGSGAAGGSGSGGTGGVTTGTGGGSGGHVGSGGVIGSGGAGTGTGGLGTGGQTTGTGGQGTGGQTTGTGGQGTGGQTTGAGGQGTGGQGTGGQGTGGQGTGGQGTGGQGTGGQGTGGQGTGGQGTGGQGTGGQGTGGQGTGGQGTGGQDAGGQGTGGQDAGSDAGGGAGNPTLYVVAHPDDELLFINPDLEADIQAGRKVRTVYVTSGDLTDYYLTREAGVMSAGAAMAGVDNNWSCTSATYAGKAVKSCTLVARPLVTSLFMRIGDGQVMNLFTGGTATTADNSSTYDQAQTLAVLAAIQAEFQPTRVGTLDGTLAYGSEHSDHIAAAFFTFDVARSDGVVRQLIMYRGYTMYADPPPPGPMPANLSVAQYAEKLRIMDVYGGPVSPGGIYDQWCQRFYPIPATPGGPGPLRANAGPCLAPTSSADGAALQVVTCDGSAGQIWTVGGDSRVVGLGGRCLGVADDGTTAVIKTCNGGADQRWTLMSSGQLKGTRDSCLTTYGTSVLSQVCGSEPNADDPPLFFPPTTQEWGF